MASSEAPEEEAAPDAPPAPADENAPDAPPAPAEEDAPDAPPAPAEEDAPAEKAPPPEKAVNASAEAAAAIALIDMDTEPAIVAFAHRLRAFPSEAAATASAAVASALSATFCARLARTDVNRLRLMH